MSFGSGAGSGQANNTVAPVAAGLNIQTSAYGLVIPIVYGRNRIPSNLIWYGAFTPIPVTTSSDGGGGGGGGKGGGGAPPASTSTTWIYTTSLALGLCEGPIDGVLGFWADKNFYANVADYFTTFKGTYPQAPWSYLTSNFPGHDFGYQGQAYMGGANYSLGSNSSTPNFSFDVSGRLGYDVAGGIYGADPADIMTDILTNAQYGAGFPAALVGDFTQYSNYCVASGLFLSPIYNNTRAASDMLDELADQSNAAIFYSEGKLKCLPYADQAVTGNGVTYTPNTTILYDVGDDDYLPADGDDPVVINRKTIADAFNDEQVEIVDSTNQYNVSVVDVKDAANIAKYGLRPDPSVFQAHAATSTEVGQLIATFRLQRNLYIRNIYNFSLGWKFCGLEPMDLITLTDTDLGLFKTPVRILSVAYQDGVFTFTAEDFLAGVSTAAVYNTQTSTGYNVNFNVDPGDVETPLIIDGPGAFTTTGFEIWAAIAGADDNWGGAEVWVSTDDETYKKVGVRVGPSRYGSLTADFPAGADPDTVNSCLVSLAISKGQLTGGTQEDADNNNLLSYVGGELISFETATLDSLYNYTLTDYIRRGVSNTPITDHPTNTLFARLDASIFKYPYDESMIGDTVFLKFLSFNKYGGGIQLLSDIDPYTFVIGGSLGAPADVLNFGGSQNGNVVVFQWDLLPQSNVDGYEIRYSPVGGHIWDNGTPLTQVTRGTTITTAKVPPGAWTFMIKARDSSLQYSQATASFDMVVTNQNVIVTVDEEDPAWLGVETNFVVHPTCVLVPDDQHTASFYGWELFDMFVPTPFPICTYEAPVIDTGADGKIRLHASITSALGPDMVGVANPQLMMKYRTSAGSFGAYQPWTIGDVDARYFQAEVSLDTSVGVCYIETFGPTADAVPFVDGASGITVAPGGTLVTFSTPYREIPNVTLTAVSTSGLIGVIHSVTTTGFMAYIFNTSDIDVGGIANWSSTGV